MCFWGKFAAAVGSAWAAQGTPGSERSITRTAAHPVLLCLCGSSVKTSAGASDLTGQEEDRAGSLHPL